MVQTAVLVIKGCSTAEIYPVWSLKHSYVVNKWIRPNEFKSLKVRHAVNDETLCKVCLFSEWYQSVYIYLRRSDSSLALRDVVVPCRTCNHQLRVLGNRDDGRKAAGERQKQ